MTQGSTSDEGTGGRGDGAMEGWRGLQLVIAVINNEAPAIKKGLGRLISHHSSLIVDPIGGQSRPSSAAHSANVFRGSPAYACISGTPPGTTFSTLKIGQGSH